MYVIDDDSDPSAWHPPSGFTLARQVGPPRGATGELRAAPAFPQELLIPQPEWRARIEEMEQQKSRISDLCDLAGLVGLNQEQTNFCWANAPVHCVEILRVMQNQSAVKLSPASVACPVTGFRNVGGWAGDSLQRIVDHGCVPVELWPANAIDRQFDTPAARTAATGYRLTSWMELVPRNMEQLISCLLRRIPVAVGFNWWGHEVTAVDPVWLNGQVAVRIDNSWGAGWGERGRGVLSGSKMYADDAFAPVAVLAS